MSMSFNCQLLTKIHKDQDKILQLFQFLKGMSIVKPQLAQRIPLPSQEPEGPIQPQPDQPVIQWKQLDLSQTFGFDPMITGTVKYPANWAVNVDTWNKRVVFSEDQSGFTASYCLLPVQGTLQDAQVILNRFLAGFNLPFQI